ncbi:heparan-alpha-glucosaminide N-acetyltransferase domain-containing protein [Cellulophaga sp. E6(2014)]|uniref:heparan-alpha-glucosaminide N-acetyltransferase domain-containing protein n=1 Tax=Cellulophaga sp. E6(2014) TaxID=1495334 RepID=UPI00051CC7A3|nr:heparan-alpha-glucosaminide N-acetyltransferase domain-containing protein [Cellulophaga sp. E6(2014)]KGK30550.1 membrane protein [Cellulophaga sp. E6(2014)]
MINKPDRLYFIDAMRAWAILMMLQGHFVDGLLDNAFRDTSHIGYNIWLYFRGITAPVFFTVSGFIFTFLLTKGDKTGFSNPRVAKGIKRGLQLLLIGYLLRLNFWGLLVGQIYNTFYLVDVLHCIGLSLLGIIALYVLTEKRKALFPIALLAITILLFIFEPNYSKWVHAYLPQTFANYFTKANGSVFTIFPWFGYATCGAFLSLVFAKFKNAKYVYPIAITTALTLGAGLLFGSSAVFLYLAETTKVQLFADIFFNNYLFIRLGDVLLVFAVFMLFRKFMTNSTLLKMGQSTLSIYVVHYIILYGSFIGVGLYYFLNHSLAPSIIIPGAIAFMITCTFLALQYEKHKVVIKATIANALKQGTTLLEPWATFAFKLTKDLFIKLRNATLKLFRLVKD